MQNVGMTPFFGYHTVPVCSGLSSLTEFAAEIYIFYRRAEAISDIILEIRMFVGPS